MTTQYTSASLHTHTHKDAEFQQADDAILVLVGGYPIVAIHIADHRRRIGFGIAPGGSRRTRGSSRGRTGGATKYKR